MIGFKKGAIIEIAQIESCDCQPQQKDKRRSISRPLIVLGHEHRRLTDWRDAGLLLRRHRFR
jgi:hypothetical protein